MKAVTPAQASQKRILTVTRLTRLIAAQLEAVFDDVWVEGEISNLRLPTSGHLYFTLKDAQAQIRAVFFRSGLRFLRFRPQEGQQVIVRGKVSVYEPRGEYQLVVAYMEPKGIGALQLAFEQLKARLAREGLFDPQRKRPIPKLPRRIGIITSPTGAAIRDILHILDRRFANLEVLICPVPVQGAEAAPAIVQALSLLNARGGLDVVILARGGGSLEDLWAFNEESVARAIAASRIPVISAVGHETDYTIADFVADLRAPTPSAAAEMVIQKKSDLVEALGHLKARLRAGIRQRLENTRTLLEGHLRALGDPRERIHARWQHWDTLRDRLTRRMQDRLAWGRAGWQHRHQSLLHRSPLARLHLSRTRWREARDKLSRRMARFLQQRRQALGSHAGRLEALSPLRVLGRGYSITHLLPEKTILKDARRVRPGDAVWVRLARGSLTCRVEDREEG